MTDTWLKDDNGNKCSVEYFGSKNAAQKALDSLENCKNCINCRDCSYCSACSDCSDCSACSDCRDCRDCRDCSDCSACSACSDCSYCSACSACSDCRAKEKTKGDFTPPTIPIIENIHKKIYEAASIPPEALDMGSWHSCNTTHCRAGWVVHLAGEQGYALERYYATNGNPGTPFAAQMIYKASGYNINPCRFYDNNDEALADMKRLAETEKAA